MKRLAALAAEHDLDNEAIERLAALLRVLANEATAPTTVKAPDVAVDRHIADALSALTLSSVSRATSTADLGAGAGVPGLVLAAARPAMEVMLVESVGKKCAFIEHAAATMGLANARAVHARAEEWPAGVGAHDLVTARALAPLTTLVEYAAPLLRVGGHLVAWKGHRDPVEEADGGAACAATGMELVEVRAVRPFPGSDAHHLHLYSKVRETPARFPRRAGMARKRPITA